MTPELLATVMSHAALVDPQEACGVLVWRGGLFADYVPCRNVAEAPAKGFIIHHEDWIMAEDSGRIVGVVHSHPHGTTDLSVSNGDPDRIDDTRFLAQSRVPWWILVPGTGEWRRHLPPTWSVLGRPFVWGVNDCLSLVRDYYGGIEDRVRGDKFWQLEDAFTNGIAGSPFEVVTDGPHVDDLLLMSILPGPGFDGVPNHCAVYLGGGMIAHHLPKRASRKEALGPLCNAITTILRRKS